MKMFEKSFLRYGLKRFHLKPESIYIFVTIAPAVSHGEGRLVLIGYELRAKSQHWRFSTLHKVCLNTKSLRKAFQISCGEVVINPAGASRNSQHRLQVCSNFRTTTHSRLLDLPNKTSLAGAVQDWVTKYICPLHCPILAMPVWTRLSVNVISYCVLSSSLSSRRPTLSAPLPVEAEYLIRFTSRNIPRSGIDRTVGSLTA